MKEAQPPEGPVLLIDDEEDLLDIMTILLRKNDCEVRTFKSPPSVQEIAALNPAVVFTDVLIKGVSGADLCRRLKSDPISQKIPVVVISAQPPTDLQAIARACRADGYLSKPFDIHEFVRMARAWVQKAALTRPA